MYKFVIYKYLSLSLSLSLCVCVYVCVCSAACPVAQVHVTTTKIPSGSSAILDHNDVIELIHDIVAGNRRACWVSIICGGVPHPATPNRKSMRVRHTSTHAHTRIVSRAGGTLALSLIASLLHMH